MRNGVKIFKKIMKLKTLKSLSKPDKMQVESMLIAAQLCSTFFLNAVQNSFAYFRCLEKVGVFKISEKIAQFYMP